MKEYKENILIRILKFLGIIKEYEIDKKEMCNKIYPNCTKHCYCCAWYDDKED